LYHGVEVRVLVAGYGQRVLVVYDLTGIGLEWERLLEVAVVCYVMSTKV
jgi:hypothetical protein